jgi:hypothetical protein
MRIAFCVAALVLGLTGSASAEIISVRTPGHPGIVTVVYGFAHDCGDQSLVIRQGQVLPRPDCVQPEPRVHTSVNNINIVVVNGLRNLAHRHDRPYIRQD